MFGVNRWYSTSIGTLGRLEIRVISNLRIEVIVK